MNLRGTEIFGLKFERCVTNKTRRFTAANSASSLNYLLGPSMQAAMQQFSLRDLIQNDSIRFVLNFYFSQFERVFCKFVILLEELKAYHFFKCKERHKRNTS